MNNLQPANENVIIQIIVNMSLHYLLSKYNVQILTFKIYKIQFFIKTSIKYVKLTIYKRLLFYKFYNIKYIYQILTTTNYG